MGESKSNGGLGFQDFECFNKAMLAKQCWRLLKQPDSLVAKIMKEKYFKKVRMVDANLGYGPSFIWRSLWSSLGLLKKGLLWRVGDGSNISVWRDKWLPTQTSHRVQSTIRNLPADAKVQQLIDIEGGEWKKDLIFNTFNGEEAEIICGIPLSKWGSIDKLVWGCSKDGKFSVKSAYHLEHEDMRKRKGETSRGNKTGNGWKMIWGLNVPNVVKHFLWRVAHNLLPTKQNLYKKQITECDKCPICEREPESIMHVVWSCPAASDVWSEGNSSVHKWDVSDFGIEELWGKLNATLKIDEVEMVACIMRKIWMRRNSLLFEKKFDHSKVIICAAMQGLAEYKMAQVQLQTNQVRSNADRSVTKWEKPGGSVIEANRDAAVDAKNKYVGIGVVVRDSNGEILACLCSRFAHNSNPYVAEALGLRKAVTFCSEMGFSDVVLEGDSLIIVNATKSGEEIGAEYGCIIDDVRRIMNGRLSWDVRFVYREANNTAHKLARFVLTVGDEKVWIEDSPVEIASDILVEKLCND